MNKIIHPQKEKYDIFIGYPSIYYKELLSLEDYQKYIISDQKILIDVNQHFKNKILLCNCGRGNSCHGSVLARVAEAFCLYRPIGEAEWDLIVKSDFKSFPPRLPDQPIFYPVCNYDYAKEIADKWNKGGHIVRFLIDKNYIEKFTPQIVGSKVHEEYWIPAEELENFNSNIIGKIESIWSKEVVSD